jgi:hypothetical protein
MGVAILGAQLIRADAPAEIWGTNWLGYSRYDGVVVTAEDLKAAPAVQTALWQYAETGGALLVLGAVRVPEGWRKGSSRDGCTAYDAGFGHCLVSADGRFADWLDDRWRSLRESWAATGQPWQRTRTVVDANREFPVVDDLGIPVRGLFVLMLLFTLTIGPVNFYVLSRKKRRIWLLWTVPALSLLTCLAVLGYMVVAEGWQGHLRTEGLTLLDEAAHRATTVGWTAFYTPLTPGDGLHFGYETELATQTLEDWRRGASGGSSCTVDWTQDQNLAHGWLTARIPAHFLVRKSEVRRERVTVARGAGGAWTMVNGLGADVRRFWYADKDGLLYAAADVPAGGQAVLEATGARLPQPAARKSWRQFYVSDWLNGLKELAKDPRPWLPPGCYCAALDAAPFIEDGLRHARSRKCRSVVLGLLKEQGDEN